MNVKLGHNVVSGSTPQDLANNLDYFWKEEGKLKAKGVDCLVVTRKVMSGSTPAGVFIIFKTAEEWSM